MSSPCPVHGIPCTWDCDPVEWAMLLPDLQARLVLALDALTARITVSDLERRLGLSRGYLGQCKPTAPRSRQPAKHLVLLLEVLVRHPEELDAMADGTPPL